MQTFWGDSYSASLKYLESSVVPFLFLDTALHLEFLSLYRISLLEIPKLFLKYISKIDAWWVTNFYTGIAYLIFRSCSGRNVIISEIV